MTVQIKQLLGTRSERKIKEVYCIWQPYKDFGKCWFNNLLSAT